MALSNIESHDSPLSGRVYSKDKPPAFQFYPKDLLSDGDAMAMPAEAFGIYIRILCYDWIDDGVRNDDRLLMRLGGFEWFDLQGKEREQSDFDTLLRYIRTKFVDHPTKEGFITNPRLQRERAAQKERSEAGRTGASARWERSKSTASKSHQNRICEADAISCSPSPSASSSPNKKIHTPPRDKREAAPGVWLTDSELEKFTAQFGAPFVTRCCEKLSAWIEQDPTPKRKRNGFNAAATLRSWVINAVAGETRGPAPPPPPTMRPQPRLMTDADFKPKIPPPTLEEKAKARVLVDQLEKKIKGIS